MEDSRSNQCDNAKVKYFSVREFRFAQKETHENGECRMGRDGGKHS